MSNCKHKRICCDTCGAEHICHVNLPREQELVDFMPRNGTIPKKKELTIHGHENCPECNKVGWNDCHDAMTSAIRENLPSDSEIIELISLYRVGDNIDRELAAAIVKLYKERLNA